MARHTIPAIKPDEKHDLRFTLSPPARGKLLNGGKYSAHVQHKETLDEKAVIRDLSETLAPRVKEPLVAFFVNSISDYIADCLKRGYHLNLGGVTIGLSITGGFESANDRFDPARHQLNVVVLPRNKLKDATAYLNPVNATETVNPQFDDAWSIDDAGEQDHGNLRTGANGFANGKSFADKDRTQIDRLWLETPAGDFVAELTIEYCSATRMTFGVPPEIAQGEYVLVARRMNPDGKSYANARYGVTVLSDT